MAQSARQGAFLLTVAQAWHALSSYVIFVTAARLLGREAFGEFGLVVWTMTALETFVVAGAPRAVSFHVARSAGVASTVTWRGLRMTVLIAACLTGALLVLAGVIGERAWDAPALIRPLRISAIDFVAFAGFAVFVQTLNGLHRFLRQASVWITYSTVKVIAVIAMLSVLGTIEAGVWGYVIASGVASVAALLASLRPIRSAGAEQDPGAAPSTGAMFRFGMPMAVHAMAMSAMLTVDLWAAKSVAVDGLEAGGYVAGSTLARVLYFVFIAFGEALFPAVARVYRDGSREEGARDRAVDLARDGMGMLMVLLLPSVALATGTAPESLAVVYGGSEAAADRHFSDAAPFLTTLAPAAAAMTFIGVASMLIAATERAGRVALALVCLLGFVVATVYLGAQSYGAQGAATGVLVATGLGAVAMTLWAIRLFRRNIVPVRHLVLAVVAAVLLHVLLRAWTPPGWWVFAYGAGLLVIVLAIFARLGVLPWRGFKQKKKAAMEAIEAIPPQ